MLDFFFSNEESIYLSSKTGGWGTLSCKIGGRRYS